MVQIVLDPKLLETVEYTVWKDMEDPFQIELD